MLTKRILFVVIPLCFTVMAVLLYFHHTSKRINEEVKPYLTTLYSLSGELNGEQKQEYVETLTNIQSIHSRTPLPKREAERVLQHSYKLCQYNPELLLMGNTIEENVSTHMHEDFLTEAERKQKRIDAVDASIAHFEQHVTDGDITPENAVNFLNFLRTMRKNIANPVLTEAEYAYRLMEAQKTDPEVIGLRVDLLTREVTNVYPNMVTIRKRKEYKQDGSVQEVYTGNFSHFSDPVIQQDVEAYLDKLSKLTPGESSPPQPDHEGLRFQVIFNDSYTETIKEKEENEISELSKTEPSESIQDSVLTPEQINEIEDFQLDSDLEELPEEQRIVDTDGFSRLMESIDNPKLEAELWEFLESFTEGDSKRTEKNLESFFEKVFIPDEQMNIEKLADILKNPIPKPKGFTPERFENALMIIEKGGISSLQKTDPDMAKYLEELFK